MPRTIELQLTSEDMANIAKDLPGCDWKPLWAAIGYLASWAAHTYPIVRIYRDGNGPDIAAVYLKADGELGYVIGAVWHDTHYGFHS
jgi:hypothetical protein